MNLSAEKALESASDIEVFGYCAKRLLNAFRLRTGWEFGFGEFRFVIHKGELVQIEDCPTFQSYRRRDAEKFGT